MNESDILDLFRSIIKARKGDFGAEYYEKIYNNPREIHGLMASSLIDGLIKSGCTEYSVWNYLTELCKQDKNWVRRNNWTDQVLAPQMGYMWVEHASRFGYEYSIDHNCFIKSQDENVFMLTINDGSGILSLGELSHRISGWHVLALWEGLLAQGVTE